MRRLRTPLVIGALILVPIVALVLGDSGARSRSAPALPGTVLAGERVTIEELRGAPVIVHFWASWCTPCTKEAPELARLNEQLGDRARLVAVDWSDSRDRALAFVRKHRWSFPVLEDTGGRSGERYRVAGLPSTFIVDRDGRIVRQLAGPQTAKGLLAEIQALEDAG